MVLGRCGAGERAGSEAQLGQLLAPDLADALLMAAHEGGPGCRNDALPHGGARTTHATATCTKLPRYFPRRSPLLQRDHHAYMALVCTISLYVETGQGKRDKSAPGHTTGSPRLGWVGLGS
jgi:hypothetical protein